MNGSLYEVGGKGAGVWRLRVYVGRTDAGVSVHTSHTFRGSKAEADAELRRLVTREEKLRIEAHTLTVGRLLDRWLSHIEADSSAYYLRETRRRIDKRLRPAFGPIRVDRVQVDAVDAQYRHWMAEGLSASTVKGFHAIMAAAFHQAERWEWITRNPLRLVKPPSVSQPKTRAPSVAEVALMLDATATDEPLLAFAIALAATTGMRRGELCALRWSDVDLTSGEILVARALTVTSRNWSEGPTKTHQERKLALDVESAAILLARRRFQEDLAEHVMVTLASDPFVLARRSDGSEPCLPDGLTHSFAALCERLDLPAGHVAAYDAWRQGPPVVPKGARRPPRAMPYHWHELRHFTATQSLVEGYDVVTVARRMGHSDPAVTLRWYSHALAARDADMAGTLGSSITVARSR